MKLAKLQRMTKWLLLTALVVTTFVVTSFVSYHAKQVGDLVPGSGFLIKHENCGGHTIERHVAKSDAYLRQRLASSNISAASTFYELNNAGQVIVNAINRNNYRVNNWLNSGNRRRLVLNYTHRRNIGKVLERGARATKATRKFRVVLDKRRCSSYKYLLLTAYPVL